MSKRAPSFVDIQRQSQSDFMSRTQPAQAGFRGAPYRLAPEYLPLNLAPSIRDLAVSYFEEKGITWHIHASHALSSQVCCLNFLMPLAQQHDALSRLVGHALGIEPPEMLAMERDAAGTPWYVAFEWIGERDHLNEASSTGNRTRGANATSADAAVRYRHEGRVTTLLIEWKYTESYGAPIKPSGNAKRIGRYANLAFAPEGPVRADLGLSVEDFFWEPFYQLLRQQMLAFHMQRTHEGGADCVKVLHISPAGNASLHAVTAPKLRQFGDDAFAAFKSVLTQPEDFIGRTAEELFAPLLAETTPATAAWSAYLLGRYDFLSPAANYSAESN